jgi:hypothetical protein
MDISLIEPIIRIKRKRAPSKAPRELKASKESKGHKKGSKELTSAPSSGSRTILCQDALEWLVTCQPLDNVITGIPDINEVSLGVTDYLAFFERAAHLILDKLHPDGYAIFMQTDRKINKSWISKSAILTNIAHGKGLKLVWHKIVLNRNVGKVDLFRPTYSHLLCFSKNGSSGAATPDVLPVSKRLYNNASPINAVVHAVNFIKRYTGTGNVIIDPFVGQGTIPVVANQMGFNVIGIDIDPAQVQKAQTADFKI